MLDAANALMADGARQFRKFLRSTRGGGAQPRYVTVQDDQAQAGYVVERVLERRERGVDAAPPGGAVPQRRPQRRARTRADAAQHPVREVRRAQVPRGRARQGPARGAALGRQPAQPHRRRSACCSCCPAWARRSPQRACDAFEAAGFRWAGAGGSSGAHRRRASTGPRSPR
ncbi:MAG: hypothetical protein MZV70_42895 [Desulfobacterales bacterium]|nr:hypothetical protein [Desulfobacterales bacterium]